jgi:hypothetical protein
VRICAAHGQHQTQMARAQWVLTETLSDCA